MKRRGEICEKLETYYRFVIPKDILKLKICMQRTHKLLLFFENEISLVFVDSKLRFYNFFIIIVLF